MSDLRGLATLLLIAAAGCGSGTEPGRAKVVTTSLPIYCFTANVAGDIATVENLFPGNVSPHDYQFSPQEARKLTGARLIITSGLGLEEWAGRVLKLQHAQLVEASAGLGNRRIASDERPSVWNPHFWLDPILATHAVTNIMLALQKADPVNSSTYAQNAAAYVEKLQRLDAEIQSALAPYKGAPIVTYHDAFPYFARRYQLQIAGVIEPVADVDPSAQRLSQLRRTIREKNVRVVFTEKDGASRLAERIRRDLNVKLAPLDPLESGDLNPTAYEEGMRRNLDVLKRTFDAPVP
jgi:zinc/manganese transport system substrate-binding protein